MIQHIVLIYAIDPDHLYDHSFFDDNILPNLRKVGTIDADDKPHACDLAQALSDHKYTRVHAVPAVKTWQPNGESVVFTHKQIDAMLSAVSGLSTGKPCFERVPPLKVRPVHKGTVGTNGIDYNA